MSIEKNPLNILESARNLINKDITKINSKNQVMSISSIEKSTSRTDEMLTYVNKEIIQIKELLIKSQFDRNVSDIHSLKKSCIDKKIIRQEDLLDISTISDLLNKLQNIRSSIKKIIMLSNRIGYPLK